MLYNYKVICYVNKISNKWLPVTNSALIFLVPTTLLKRRKLAPTKTRITIPSQASPLWDSIKSPKVSKTSVLALLITLRILLLPWFRRRKTSNLSMIESRPSWKNTQPKKIYSNLPSPQNKISKFLIKLHLCSIPKYLKRVDLTTKILSQTLKNTAKCLNVGRARSLTKETTLQPTNKPNIPRTRI
jgi:hypothetical protein